MAKVSERFKFATTLFTCTPGDMVSFLDDIISIDLPVMVLSGEPVEDRCCLEENQMTYKVVLEITADTSEEALDILGKFCEDANELFGEDNGADLAPWFHHTV